MFIPTRKFTATVLFAAGVASFAGFASAAPVNGTAIKSATPSNVESVQWRRGWGWGGVGAGFVAGAIVGGMLAAAYYGYGPYYGPAYGYGPYYGGPYYGGPYVAGPVYRAAPVYRSAVAYCMSRFRSYNPRTGTYLGYDGLRHRCP